MSDKVVGIAVLDPTMVPQQLAMRCLSATQGELVQIIPVYAAGTPKPETRNGAAWEYRVVGDVLHITPSVHVQASALGPQETLFHNDYSWSVQFIEAGPRECDPDWPTKHLWRDLRAANPGTSV